MKSTAEALRKRGLPEQADLDRLKDTPYDTLIDLINSPLAAERTAAVRVLAARNPLDERFVRAILGRLCHEESLYTKLEICTALEQGDVAVARLMALYLGRIGQNRHRTVPDRVSKKVSFPLPRDIVARSLGRMSPAVLPALLEVLDDAEPQAVSEVLDAIGYMVFYHSELATAGNTARLLAVAHTVETNDLLLWKAVLCLSAFPRAEVLALLERIIATHPNTTIQNEAVRSIRLIRSRKGG